MFSILSITLLGVLVLFLGILKKKPLLLPVILFGLLIALGITVSGWGNNTRYYNDMLIMDNFAIAFSALLIVATFLVFMFAGQYYKAVQRPLDDIYGVMIFAVAGGIMMTSFGNLIILFLGLETLSIALYILAGSHKEAITSNEATLKYFLLGSFISCFLLLGMALIYGASGELSLQGLSAFTAKLSHPLPPMFLTGLFLIIVGLSFKIAIFPFHFWAPDVYEGTPTLLTAFMATVVKTAGIAALYRLFVLGFPGLNSTWAPTLAILAALTILVGNFTGLYQPNLKRMLAYSSISHSGYMILAVLAMGKDSAGILLYYAASYSLATVTAFAVLILVREATGNDQYVSFRGLSRKNPLEALCLTIALLSLTGIPPLAGFIAKYSLFTIAVEKGYLWLVIIAIIGSAVSVAYYFKPITAMYLKQGENIKLDSGMPFKFHIIFITLLTILLGVLPFLVLGLI